MRNARPLKLTSSAKKHEGWTLLPAFYSDGGYTGANIERPGVRQLLADIEAGKIDCVAVYKVDRLSRSLIDFGRMMEMFEKNGVCFVSITQQFNTNSSLGRLTLNILLSFVLTGLFTYLLVRDLTGSRAAGLLSGVAFAFCPFRFMQMGHLHMLATAWFPFTLWMLAKGLGVRDQGSGVREQQNQLKTHNSKLKTIVRPSCGRGGRTGSCPSGCGSAGTR